MAQRSFRLALLTVAIGAAFGVGALYAQPGGDTKPADPTTAPAPAPTSASTGSTATRSSTSRAASRASS